MARPPRRFAALNVLGKVIGRHAAPPPPGVHPLPAIEADIPAGKGVACDPRQLRRRNKHAKVRAWLGRHERFTFHFVPTSCSWLNRGLLRKSSEAAPETRRLPPPLSTSRSPSTASPPRDQRQPPCPSPGPPPDKIIAAGKTEGIVRDIDSILAAVRKWATAFCMPSRKRVSAWEGTTDRDRTRLQLSVLGQ